MLIKLHIVYNSRLLSIQLKYIWNKYDTYFGNE